MCGCKVGRMARKKSAGKSVTITTEDVAWGVGGAVLSLAANGLLNKATANMPENTRGMIGKVLPIAKVVGGGAAAMGKNTPRNWKFFGLGVAGTGAVEFGVKQAPQYFSINGAGGADVFDLLSGTSVVEIPIEPSGKLNGGYGGSTDDTFVAEPILGAADEEMMIL